MKAMYVKTGILEAGISTISTGRMAGKFLASIGPATQEPLRRTSYAFVSVSYCIVTLHLLYHLDILIIRNYTI